MYHIKVRDDVVHEIRIDGIPYNDKPQYSMSSSSDTLRGDKRVKRPSNLDGEDTFPGGS